MIPKKRVMVTTRSPVVLVIKPVASSINYFERLPEAKEWEHMRVLVDLLLRSRFKGMGVYLEEPR